MSTTIIDGAIKEFMSRMSDNYDLGEEGNQWVVETLQDVLYPLVDQLPSEGSSEPSQGGDIKELLQQLIQQQATATPQSGSPSRKRGTSGWLQFVQHMKKEEPDAKHNFQSCSPLWRGMSDEEKEVFNQKAKEVNAKAPAAAAATGGAPTKAKKPNPWNEFTKVYKKECDAKGIKYTPKGASEAYQKLKSEQQA